MPLPWSTGPFRSTWAASAYAPLVPRLDNPAGRLHVFLTQYRSIAEENRSIHHTWAEVLGVEQQEVPVALAAVAGLIPTIEAAVSRSGDEDQSDAFNHYGSAWASSVIAPHRVATQTPSPGKELVDQGALVALGSLSAFLSATQSEGAVPAEGSVEDLKGQVVAAIDELGRANEVPVDVRRLMHDRLHDVLWALDRLRIGGPDAVQAAVDRLVVSVVTAPQDAQRTSAVKKVWAAACAVAAAFLAGPRIQSSIDAWAKMGELLPGPGG